MTTDASGNLAASPLGPDTLTALDTRVARMENNLADLNRGLRRAYAGTAGAIAMGGTMIPADQHLAVSFNLATFRGQQGYSGAIVARVSQNVWVNAAAAGSTQRGSTGGRVGMTFGW